MILATRIGEYLFVLLPLFDLHFLRATAVVLFQLLTCDPLSGPYHPTAEERAKIEAKYGKGMPAVVAYKARVAHMVKVRKACPEVRLELIPASIYSSLISGLFFALQGGLKHRGGDGCHRLILRTDLPCPHDHAILGPV